MSTPLAPFPPYPTPTPTPRRDRGPLIQRALLAAGALCVLVAGGVYLAVSWDRLGTVSQTGLALLVTALAATAAHLLARRELRASAETLAVVASGLLALDLAGAHHLDVLGAAGLEWWSWIALATGVVAVVSTVLALVSALTAYRVVAVAAVTALPFTAAVAGARARLELPVAGTTAAALAVAAGLVALAARLGRRDQLAALTACVGATGWWGIAVIAGLEAAWSTRLAADVVPAGVLWTVTATTLLVLAGRVLAGGRQGDTRIVVSVAAPLAAAPAVVVVVGALTSLGPVAVLVAAAALALVPALRWSATSAGRPLAAAAAAVSVLLAPVALLRGLGFDLTAAVVLLAALGAGATALRSRGAVRVAAACSGVVAAVLGVALLAVERAEPGLWLASGWTVLAVALLGTATVSRRAEPLVAGGVVGALAGLAGFADQLLDTRSPALVVALLGVGAATVVVGAVRIARSVVVLGASLLATAALDLAAIARIDAVEAYTLPVAAVALLAGLLARNARPELTSWAWAAPAIVVAVLPTAVVAFTDPGLARLVLAAAAGALLLAVGVTFRLAAPLLLGAATEAVLAVSQLAPYAVGAPRWVTLALAGVLLLTLGVLFERARRSAAAAGRWFAALG